MTRLMNVSDIFCIITNEFKYFRFNNICLQNKMTFCFILFCSLFLFFDLVLFLCFGILYFSKTLFSLLKNLMVCLTCDHFVTWL